MSRVISVFLPDWPIERLPPGDAGPDQKLVLAGHDGRRRIVTAVNAAVRRAGVQPGMAKAQAQILAPGLAVRPADPAGDEEGLARLALWALRYTPLAAPDQPDGLVLDVTGAAHLWGGEEALVADLCARLARRGITARAALADNRGAAHALARFVANPTWLTQPGSSGPVLLSLPVAALRLPQKIMDGLHKLGLRRIGDLTDAPRAPLTRRFGPELQLRLDQAFGRVAEPVAAIAPPNVPEAARDFPEPLTAPEALANHIGQLVEALCATLTTQAAGARRLDLFFHRVDHAVLALRLGLAAPRQDAPRLARLLRERLEEVDPGFGIERLVLRASWTEPFTPRQTAALEQHAAPDLAPLIDTLASRVGAHNLYRMAPVESDVPERSLRRIPPLAPLAGKAWPSWPRPARLLSSPEPIATMALLPDHPPISFTWRGVRRRVARADGPERIFGEWWKRDAELFAVRDYFQVEDETGARFWIFRAGDGEDTATGSQDWFLHGFFA
jgi:protein ImuB